MDAAPFSPIGREIFPNLKETVQFYMSLSLVIVIGEYCGRPSLASSCFRYFLEAGMLDLWHYSYT